MDEKLGSVVDDVADAATVVSGEDASTWLDLSDGRWQVLLVFIALLVAVWTLRKVRRFFRRRRKPTIHPKLQKYERRHVEPDPKLKAQRREEAGKIIATSSTSRIAGFEIVEQIEAIIVDGFAGPEDAIEGLKAAAAMKGANAVINVHRDRVEGGTCSAAGDAVVVRKPMEKPAEATGDSSAASA